MEDERIIQLFWERSEQALAQTQRKYGKLLHHVASSILRDSRDVEEAAMDTYLRLWNSIPPNRPSSLLAYSARLCRNSSIDILRQRSRAKRDSRVEVLFSELDECLVSPGNPASRLEEKELVAQINRYLGTLDALSRILFIRRYFSMEKLDELSREFSLSKHVVSARLYRVRQGLKKYLQKEGVSV